MPLQMQMVVGIELMHSVAANVPAAAALHHRAAFLLVAVHASLAHVIADTLAETMVAAAFHSMSHAAGAARGVAVLLHARLGAWETSCAACAAMIQRGIILLFATALPDRQVLLVHALATSHFCILLCEHFYSIVNPM